MSGDDHNNTTEAHDGSTCLVCRTFLGIAPVNPRIFAELHRPGAVPLVTDGEVAS